MNFRKTNLLIGFVVVFLLLVSVFAFTGQAQNNEDRFFGFSTTIVQNVWEGLFYRTFGWYCEDRGWKYNRLQARGEPTLQSTHIRRLVDMGADGLVVTAHNADIPAKAVEYAAENDVPVITTDADVNSESVLMYVGYSGVRASEILGERIVEFLKNELEPIGEVEGRVLEIRGPLGGASAEERHKGFIEVMNQYERISVETVVGDYQLEPAKSAALPKVRARDFDVLYSGNGPMAIGGISAMEDVGKNVEEKFIVTIDAVPSVIDAINEGKIDAAFDQPVTFYNPIALHYLNEYLEEGEEALPEVGETITADDLKIEPGEHANLTWWETPNWAPAKITTRAGHLWFQTAGLLVNESNANLPSLWANAELAGW